MRQLNGMTFRVLLYTIYAVCAFKVFKFFLYYAKLQIHFISHSANYILLFNIQLNAQFST